jgi:hypothetical protein
MCEKCKEVFECGGVKRVYTNYYEDILTPEDYLVCPACNSEDYTKVEFCESCRQWIHYYKFLDENTCNKCVFEEIGAKECYEVSKFEEKKKIEINYFLASMFDVGDIEKILLDLLVNSKEKIDLKEYINGDKDWFLETYLSIRKEERNDENAKG